MPLRDDPNLKIPIVTDVTISLHPGTAVEVDFADLEATATSEAGARAIAAAMGEMYSALGDATRAHKKLIVAAATKGGPVRASDIRGRLRVSVADPDAEYHLATASKTRFDAVAPKVQASMNRAEAAVKELDERIARALAPKADAAAAEIRAHSKQLPSAKRFAFLRDAVREGDLRTVTAVLGAPAYLSGVGDDELVMLQDDARDRWAPAEHRARKALARALERARAAEQLFVNGMKPFIKAAGRPATKGRVRDEALGRLAKGGL